MVAGLWCGTATGKSKWSTKTSTSGSSRPLLAQPLVRSKRVGYRRRWPPFSSTASTAPPSSNGDFCHDLLHRPPTRVRWAQNSGAMEVALVQSATSELAHSTEEHENV